MNEQTKENLLKAMHGEAFAYAKYMLFAEHARKKGLKNLANLFEKTAKVERLEHFREEAELVGLVGTDADNLKDAMKGESYEIETMYPEFATQASVAGDKAAADRFNEIREDERGHFEAYRKALQQLEKTKTRKQK